MLLKEFLKLVIEGFDDTTNPGRGSGGRAVSSKTPQKEKNEINKEQLTLAKKIIHSLEETTIWTNKDLGSGRTDASVIDDIRNLIENYEHDDRFVRKAYQLLLDLYMHGIKEVGLTSTQTDVQDAYKKYIWYNNIEEYNMIVRARDLIEEYYIGESNG